MFKLNVTITKNKRCEIVLNIVFRRNTEIYLAPSLSEVSYIIDSIYHNKLILSLSVSCKQLAGLNVVSNSFGVVIFWGIRLGDSKI